LDDHKLDKLFPSEHDGVVGHKSYQHIPESDSHSDNIAIELLFVVDNHIPDIRAQNNKNGNKQGGLERINLKVFKRMLKPKYIDNKHEKDQHKFGAKSQIMNHIVLGSGVSVVDKNK
jgi:hypothetical protein